MLRLLAALIFAVVLLAACGSDANKPLHRQAIDAYKRWQDSFETAEYATTALGVGERPTGAFQFQGETKHRKDPESLWITLDLQDEPDGDFQQLRVEDEEFILLDGVWTHQGSVDEAQGFALESELRSMLGAPLFTDHKIIERWLSCADEPFGATNLQAWQDRPVWIIRCRANDSLEDEAASDLVKSVMTTLFGQAPGASQQLEERIDAREVNYLLALQAIIHRQSGALLLVDLAITLTDDDGRSDIRWQMELLRYDQPIDFPAVPD